MAHMKKDMTDVWNSFILDLEAYLEQIHNAGVDAFAKVLPVTASKGEDDLKLATNPHSALQTLVDLLHHHKELALYGVDKAIEDFKSEVSWLQTEAFSPVRMAFIGMYMEDTYHAANLDSGELIYS